MRHIFTAKKDKKAAGDIRVVSHRPASVPGIDSDALIWASRRLRKMERPIPS